MRSVRSEHRGRKANDKSRLQTSKRCEKWRLVRIKQNGWRKKTKLFVSRQKIKTYSFDLVSREVVAESYQIVDFRTI